jgi:hypothetical protein
MESGGERRYRDSENYLRTNTEPPSQLPLGVDPHMEALERHEGLSRMNAVNELERIGDHSSESA